jgi:hypothetical protein
VLLVTLLRVCRHSAPSGLVEQADAAIKAARLLLPPRPYDTRHNRLGSCGARGVPDPGPLRRAELVALMAARLDQHLGLKRAHR